MIHSCVIHQRGPCKNCGGEHAWAYFACRCGVCGPPRALELTAREDASAHHRAAREVPIQVARSRFGG